MTINDDELKVFGTQFVVTSESLIASRSEDELKHFVKHELITQLVYKLVEQKHIEFTVQDDPTMNNKIFRARIVALPDSIIANLRRQGAFNNKEI